MMPAEFCFKMHRAAFWRPAPQGMAGEFKRSPHRGSTGPAEHLLRTTPPNMAATNFVVY